MIPVLLTLVLVGLGQTVVCENEAAADYFNEEEQSLADEDSMLAGPQGAAGGGPSAPAAHGIKKDDKKQDAAIKPQQKPNLWWVLPIPQQATNEWLQPSRARPTTERIVCPERLAELRRNQMVNKANSGNVASVASTSSKPLAKATGQDKAKDKPSAGKGPAKTGSGATAKPANLVDYDYDRPRRAVDTLDFDMMPIS